MTRVLYDSNVILDVMAAHTVTTLHYLLERDAGTEGARRALMALLGFLAVEPVDRSGFRGPGVRVAGPTEFVSMIA